MVLRSIYLVIRDSLKCLTCDHISTVRVSVGHNSFQRHDFACEGCGEPIGLGMHVNFQDTTTSMEYCENCEKAFEEGTIVNLNPHFLIPESSVNQDLHFSWMHQVFHIQENNSIKPILIKDNSKPKFLQDIYEELGGLSMANELWGIVKKSWSLHNNKKSSLAERILKKYNAPAFKGKKSLQAVTKDFIYRLTLPKAYILTNLGLESLKEAKDKNLQEFRSFQDYYLKNISNKNTKRYLDTFTDFFENYYEFDQALLYVKNASHVPESHVATSYAFSRTSMFYGNAYENYTTNIAILACVNNIIEGRKFDEFKSITLENYLSSNKANRGKSFSDNENLNPFLDCIDNSLRNASHHRAMEIADHGRKIQYITDSKGTVQTIPYSGYLEKCNQLLLSMASLYLVETELRTL